MAKQTLIEKIESVNEQLNLTHYWIIFLKYKKLLFLLPLAIGLLGYLIALNINPVFQSTATIVIESDLRKVTDIEEVYATESVSRFGSYNHINNQMQIMMSDEIYNGVLENEEGKKKIENLYRRIPTNFIDNNLKAIKKLIFFQPSDQPKKEANSSSKEKVLKQYIKNNFKVTNIRNSDVVELSFQSNSPELAKLLLTEIIESYLRYDVDTKVKVTAHANKQINLRMVELLKNMEKAEKDLLKYKKDNSLIDIGDIKTLKTEQIKSVSKRGARTIRK